MVISNGTNAYDVICYLQRVKKKNINKYHHLILVVQLPLLLWDLLQEIVAFVKQGIIFTTLDENKINMISHNITSYSSILVLFLHSAQLCFFFFSITVFSHSRGGRSGQARISGSSQG